MKPRAGLPWLCVPLVLYGLVLTRLWFNAPLSDDYDAILGDGMRMVDAHSLREWLAIAVEQHNEHRIAVMRVVAWALSSAAAPIDFRLIAAIGNLAVAGICVLAWLEFRAVVPAPLFAAAGFLMCPWTYYEASLMASAALPNIGVVFFSLACLYLAARGRAAGALACVAFGLLAVGSQGNGLFALPLAAFECARRRRHVRATVLGAVALLLWSAYFRGYVHPPEHPPLAAALHEPLAALELFLLVIGGIVPGFWIQLATGASLLCVLASLAWRGAWRASPTAGLWVAFLLLSVAAAAVARVGFGVAPASRYAVYSSALAMIAFLAACAGRPAWRRPELAGAVIACVAVALVGSWRSWNNVSSFSRAGHLLVMAVPASPGVTAERYFGMVYPRPLQSAHALDEARQRGLYEPPARRVYASAVRAIAPVPPGAHVGGYLDHVTVSGSRIHADGWTEVPPLAPHRTLAAYPATGTPRPLEVAATQRPDVAMTTGQLDLLFSGLRMEIDYPSPAEAAAAAEALCIVVEIPGRVASVLPRANGNCPPRDSR